jgi:hypothetical protein
MIYCSFGSSSFEDISVDTIFVEARKAYQEKSHLFNFLLYNLEYMHSVISENNLCNMSGALFDDLTHLSVQIKSFPKILYYN